MSKIDFYQTKSWELGVCWSCAVDRMVVLDEDINETMCEDCLDPIN
jgi:hypothetical protein